MPMINGRYYMNPKMGAALEEARGDGAEKRVPPNDPLDETDGEDGAKDGTGGRERDGRGRFRAPGRVHHVEIECADGGYVAHVLHGPDGQDGAAGDNSDGKNGAGADGKSGLRRSAHVFTDHRDLVEFLRNAFAKHA